MYEMKNKQIFDQSNSLIRYSQNDQLSILQFRSLDLSLLGQY